MVAGGARGVRATNASWIHLVFLIFVVPVLNLVLFVVILGGRCSRNVYPWAPNGMCGARATSAGSVQLPLFFLALAVSFVIPRLDCNALAR